MTVYRLSLLVLVVFSATTSSLEDGDYENKLVTFNTALMKSFPKTEERKNELIRQLQDMDSDIVCLQEVFYGSDVREIVAALSNTFPFSYSLLHDDDGKLRQPNWHARPCATRTLDTFKCVTEKCDTSQSNPTVFACAMMKCKIWQNLNQECITCVVVTGIQNAVKHCILSQGTQMNIPGLLLLSKRQLRDRKIVQFIPEKKQIIPRLMLVTNVERFGNVSCTHLTSNAGPVYSEPELQGMFSSWEEQNEYEAKFIFDYFKYEKVVVMGDLNTGPKIKDINITAELEGSYDVLMTSGFTSPFVTLVGKATYSDENILIPPKERLAFSPFNSIIDHVLLTKGFKAVSAKRILDKNIDRIGSPLSDHYGVEVSVVKEECKPRWITV